ncbi:enoyl-CoA hydratase [Gorgonomyces haynaldii]|nr:enoyl-CoA hydratase [Gorgonomyces haynaldii]
MLSLTVKNKIAVLKFNQPKTLNALTESMGFQFKQTLSNLHQQDIRCLVLHGEGRAFSAGGDLNFLLERTKQSLESNTRTMHQFYSIYLKSLVSVPFPTIACINGHAVGAGACLSLGADIRIASDKAKIGFNFVKLGISPGMGSTFTLPRLIGHERASKFLLTGKLFTALECHQLGLVSEVTENPLDRAMALADEIAKTSPIASKWTVKAIRHEYQSDALDNALSREATHQAECFANKDILVGLKAIQDKTDPVF